MLQLPSRSHNVHWNGSQAGLCSCLFPPGTLPPGGQEHYTAQQAFTLDGGPYSLHTPVT